jgi:hypothetical protein
MNLSSRRRFVDSNQFSAPSAHRTGSGLESQQSSERPPILGATSEVIEEHIRYLITRFSPKSQPLRLPEKGEADTHPAIVGQTTGHDCEISGRLNRPGLASNYA